MDESFTKWDKSQEWSPCKPAGLAKLSLASLTTNSQTALRRCLLLGLAQLELEAAQAPARFDGLAPEGD